MLSRSLFYETSYDIYQCICIKTKNNDFAAKLKWNINFNQFTVRWEIKIINSSS